MKDRRNFLALLAADAATGGSIVYDLDEAVDNLFWHLRGWKGDKMTVAERAVYRAAKAATEEATRGQAFRLDTNRGPIFIWTDLYKFAGRCGSLEGPYRNPWFAPEQAGMKRSRRPAWALGLAVAA